MAYMLFYVDDIILIASFHDLHKSIMVLLASEFLMKDLDPLSYFIGIFVKRHACGLFLSHNTYASDIIAPTVMTCCNPSASTIDTKHKLRTSSDTV